MAVDIETIGIGFDTSGLQRGQRELDKTRGAANKTADAADKTGRSFSALSSAVKTAAAALAVLGVAAVAREFVQAADAVALMNARLKLASTGTAEFEKAQKAVYEIAQQNRIGLEETAALYVRLSEPVKRLGGDMSQVIAITDSFQKALQLGGVSAQEAASATMQFAQAMGKGTLDGAEFTAIAEASPRVLKAIADGAGLPIEKLKQLGSDGKLTAETVGNALMKVRGQLSDEFATLPTTVGGALTRIKNDWLLAVDEINQQSGLTGGLTDVLEVARKLIPTIKDELVGAFSSVGEWIERNREMLGEVWDITKSIIGDAWELVKGFASVAGGVAEIGVQTGIVQTALIAVRYLIAGLQDGVKFVGAAFAALGSLILKVVLLPLQLVLTASAKIAGVFNDDLAAKINGVNAQISGFASAGANYAKEVMAAFGNGDTAVARLTASMGVAKTATESANSEAKKTSETYVKLGGNIKAAGSGEESKRRAKALKDEADAAKKAADEYNRLIERLMGERDDLRGQATEQRDHNQRIGLSSEAIAELDAQKLESAAAGKELEAVMNMEGDATGVTTLLLRQQADALRERAQLIRQGAISESIVEEQRRVAEASQKVWDNFTENVQRNLGDNFYNIMQGNFKGIGDGFKSMIDRMVAEALAADLANKMFGAKGTTGGGMFGGLLDKAMGWMGLGGGGASSSISSPAEIASAGDMGVGLMSFDGGGFTGGGSRAGGIDGRGGFPAILHPQETVIDHAKGGGLSGGTSSNVTINQTINFSSPGPVTRETQQQLAASAYQGAQRGRRNL